jgi:hypothetical protein
MDMNTRISGLLLFAVVFATTAARAATEMLDYSGSIMNIVSEWSFGGSGPGPFALTGWVVLSSPLGMNVTDATVVPTSWSFDTPRGHFVVELCEQPDQSIRRRQRVVFIHDPKWSDSRLGYRSELKLLAGRSD